MKNFYENSEDHLRSKLLEHEFQFAPAAWEDMQRRLDGKSGNRTPGGWWKWAWLSVSAAAAGTAGLVWLSLSATEHSQPLSMQQPLQQTVSAPIRHEINFQVPVRQNGASQQTPSRQQIAREQTPKHQEKPKASSSSTANHKTNKSQKQVAPETNDQNVASNANLPQGKDGTEAIDEETRTLTRITRIQRVYSHTALQDLRLGGQDGRMPLGYAGADNDTALFRIDRIPQRWKSRWKVGATAGVSAKQYTTGSKGVSGFAGVFARFAPVPRHAVEVGLQYKHLPYQVGKSQPKSFTADAYWNQSLQSTQVYTLRDFHFLELPVAYRFTPHRKHHLTVGAKAAYLMNARSQAPKSEGINNRKSLDLRAFAASAFLGYEFSLCDHMDLGIQYNLGLTDMRRPSDTELLQWQDEAPLQGVPVIIETQKVVDMPGRLRNSDVQVFVKYAF